MFLTHYQNYGTVLLVLILLYVLAFAIGMGPIFWLFSAEIFPTRLRGYGSSMSATGNWAADLLVSISFLTLVASIGLSFTFSTGSSPWCRWCSFTCLPPRRGRSRWKLSRNTGRTIATGSPLARRTGGVPDCRWHRVPPCQISAGQARRRRNVPVR